MRKGLTPDRGGRRSLAPVEPDADAGAGMRRDSESARKRIAHAVPVRWLEGLLSASVDLPIFGGELAVVHAAADAFAAIADGYALGITFVPEPGPSAGPPSVVRRVPPGLSETASGAHPTRIFPGMAREHVAAVPGGSGGSSLHIASSDDDLDDPGSPAAHFAERAAIVLGRALAHARAITALGDPPGSSHRVDERLLQADKLANFGQIAAGVVHELNNPLTSILAYSEHLLRHSSARDAHADPGDVERLRRINESATRMLQFTRDLVSYARPSSGVAGPAPLLAIVDQAIAFCEHVLTAAGVRVERRYGERQIAVVGVAEQLVQVFVNLLTNASQAAPPSAGRVVVTTALAAASAGPRAVVVIEDNGGGIAPEHLPHVFVPFFTTKGDRHGTGLGLAIVRSIVESHGGVVRVESELGRGTRFEVELPVWRDGRR